MPIDSAPLLPSRRQEQDLPLLLDHNSVLREIQVRSRLDAESLDRPLTTPDPALRGLLRISAEKRAGGAGGIPAVAAPTGRKSLDELLRHRSSVRTYGSRPVAVEAIAAMVHRASDFDRSAWPDHGSGAELEFLVAARDVSGLPRGLYLFSPERGDFTALADLPGSEAAGDLVLQLEFADAPAIVLVCGPLAGSLDRHGEHGHRLLLTRAGAAAHTAWLTALDLGLVGSIFAGFLSAALKPLVPVDGYRSTQLLAFSLGHAPTGEDG
ncbi:nitroreductase family protein [Kitasatospora sp. NPDC036755]|uniref:nitroreductase family protein n=1 Tax=Kitasatospora sp. NPDC036755 TaxID=3154600 RepID=UPI0033CAC2A7